MIAGAVYSKHATPDHNADLDGIFKSIPSQKSPVPPAEGEGVPAVTKPTEELDAAVETGKVTAREALLSASATARR